MPSHEIYKFWCVTCDTGRHDVESRGHRRRVCLACSTPLVVSQAWVRHVPRTITRDGVRYVLDPAQLDAPGGS